MDEQKLRGDETTWVETLNGRCVVVCVWDVFSSPWVVSTCLLGYIFTWTLGKGLEISLGQAGGGTNEAWTTGRLWATVEKLCNTGDNSTVSD
jgi:hypothetical protein